MELERQWGKRSEKRFKKRKPVVVEKRGDWGGGGGGSRGKDGRSGRKWMVKRGLRRPRQESDLKKQGRGSHGAVLWETAGRGGGGGGGGSTSISGCYEDEQTTRGSQG